MRIPFAVAIIVSPEYLPWPTAIASESSTGTRFPASAKPKFITAAGPSPSTRATPRGGA